MWLIFKSNESLDTGYYRKKKAAEMKLGRKLSKEEFERDYYEKVENGGGYYERNRNERI